MRLIHTRMYELQARGCDKISKTLQGGGEGHLIIGRSDKLKMLQEGGLTHYTTKQSVSFEELTKGYNSVSVWGLKLK